MITAKPVIEHKTRGKFKGIERRRAARFPFEHSFRFQIVRPCRPLEYQLAKSRNLSQSGMLFRSMNPPPRASHVLLDVDSKALTQLIELGQRFAVVDGKLVGRVRHTHLNLDNGLFDVGVEFVRSKPVRSSAD